MARRCSVCEAPVAGLGLCNKHYLRMRAHGDPLVTKRAPNGAGGLDRAGYRKIHRTRKIAFEHVEIAERALGHALPPGAEVHHVNEIKSDNCPSNLVICPDRTYHKLLHRRTEALDACGHADWRRCTHCHRYDDPLRLRHDGFHTYHSACRAAYLHAKREARS